MRNWHPLSKLITVVGIIGLSLSWWLEKAEVQKPEMADSQKMKNIRIIRETKPRPLEARKLPSIELFQNIVERPLFASTRRPPPIEHESELDGDSESVFHAYFIGSIEWPYGRRALFSNAQGLHSAAVGDEIDGWTLMELEQRRVILSLNNEKIELSIFK